MVLLTATVTPHPRMTDLAIANPDERRDHYAQTLRWITGPHMQGIVHEVILAENSGANLNDLTAAVSDQRLRLLSCPRHDRAPWTRGHHELLLIRDALAVARPWREPSTVVWKVTGRYRLDNLHDLLRAGMGSADLAVTRRVRPRAWAEMSVMGMTEAGAALLDTAIPRVVRAHEGHHGRSTEELLEGVLTDLEAEGAHVADLPVEPRLRGLRGRDGRRWHGPVQRTKWMLRTWDRRR